MNPVSSRRLVRRAILAGLVLLLALAVTVAALVLMRPGPEATPGEIELLLRIFGGETVPAPEFPAGVRRRSQYVTMPDGVRIAVDVLLPASLSQGARLPAVFIPTRYWRSWDLRFGMERLLGRDTFQRMLAAHGYAVVLVDARGSGASFGSRPYPWSPEELEDYATLMDWALAQPWCDGNLAATGISYSGTCAEFMAGLGQPALKAVIPQFSLYDAYTDIAFPGGVFNLWFVQNWSHFNRQLDALRVPDFVGPLGALLVRGPRPVPPPPHGPSDGLPYGRLALELALLDRAVNVDIHEAASQARCRDDYSPLAGASIDDFSPHARKAATEAAGVAFYSWGGWHDGAYARALLHRFTSLNVPQRAVIGPWNHGAVQDTNPFAPRKAKVHPPLRVHYLEQIRFLDFHCKGRGALPALELRYYTMGRETWSATRTWPPEGIAPLPLHALPGGLLSRESPPEAGQSRLLMVAAPDSLGTGEFNRWRTQIGRTDVYTPPRPVDSPGVLAFTSPPLQWDVECTGAPVVELQLQVDRDDATVFAYLEDVPPEDQPEAEIRNVTEGMLRLVHRAENPDGAPLHSFRREDMQPLPPGVPVRARFALLPTSYEFRKGRRIRLSLTLQDDGQFERTPPSGQLEMLILHDASAPMLVLPAREG